MDRKIKQVNVKAQIEKVFQNEPEYLARLREQALVGTQVECSRYARMLGIEVRTNLTQLYPTETFALVNRLGVSIWDDTFDSTIQRYVRQLKAKARRAA